MSKFDVEGGESLKKDLLLRILKDIDNDKEVRVNDYEGVTSELFVDVLEIAADEGFVKNVSVTRSGRGGQNVVYYTKGAKITLSGLNYLEKNS